MSDSISKYHDLVKETPSMESEHQRGVRILCEVLSAASCADLVQELTTKAFEISMNGPNLTPVTVFQIAGDSVKVDELCNK
jgi:hypothetical protein